MTQAICPRCQRAVSFQQGTTDFVHTCDSGNSVLDNEDIVDIRKPNWNMQGASNGANAKSRIRGIDIKNRTIRGNNASTTYTRQHQEFIEVKDARNKNKHISMGL